MQLTKYTKLKEGIKQNSLPVLGYSKKEINDIAYFDENSDKISDKFWPGPLTLILKVKDKKIEESLGLDGKIAVRVPNHPCTLDLLKECKLLVGTSANFSGHAAFNDSRTIIGNFTGYDVLLDGGKIFEPGESTVIEFEGNKLKIVRQGKIKSESLV